MDADEATRFSQAVADAVIDQTMRAAVAFNFADDARRGLTGSFLGGLAYPSPAAEPVLSAEGEPLYPLAQLDCAAIDLEGFPDHGFIQVLFLPGDLYGMSYEDASVQDTWRVRYLEELPLVSGALETVTLPPVDNAADTPFEPDFPGVALEASPIEQPVTSECDDFEEALERVLSGYPREQVDAADEELGGIEEAVSTILWEYGHPDVQAGGYPSFTQSDVRRDREGDLLLLQVETIDDVIVWGDDGVGNVFVPADDLARLDFSNAYYTWDCG